MRCPHCTLRIHFEPEESPALHIDEAAEDTFVVHSGFCPACGELIVLLRRGVYDFEKGDVEPDSIKLDQIIYPRQSARPPLPWEVPEHIREDYNEASQVLPLSPKASAALSRRLLQHILREHWKIKHRSLAQEIEQFLAMSGVPSYLAEALDAVRAIGNLAAHPAKDQTTGLIVDVEPGEAEWLLEVIELLCDFSYVQPKLLEQRKQQLNEKLQSVGKPLV